MAIGESFRKITGIEVPVESIAIKAGTVSLKGINQADKSTIFIKKQALLKDINASQTIRKIDDIR